jgi:hypothetical protein
MTEFVRERGPYFAYFNLNRKDIAWLPSLASPIDASKIRRAFPANFTVEQLIDDYFGPAKAVPLPRQVWQRGTKLLCRSDKKR